MFKIGLDLGYGYVKGISEEGKKVSFPSLVGNAYNRNLAGLFGKKDNNVINNIHVSLNDGKEERECFVGELARRESRNVSYAFDEDKINHPNTKVLIASGTAMLLPDEEVQLHVVSGLPLEHYIHQKKDFETMLKGFKTIVTFKGYDLVRIVKFDRVTIFPQAAGAVYHAIMDDLKKYLIKGSYIGLIDIGFKTTDFIVFMVDRKLTLREDLSGTIDVGMYVVNNSADKFFTERTGTKLDIPELIQLVRDGRIFYRGREMNFEREINAVKSEIARVIKDRIKAVWGSKLDFFNTVFLVGGGAKALGHYLSNIYDNTVLVKNAQFANAKGFLRVAEIEEKKAVK